MDHQPLKGSPMSTDRFLFTPFAEIEENFLVGPDLVAAAGLESWAGQFKLGTAGYRDLLDPEDLPQVVETPLHLGEYPPRSAAAGHRVDDQEQSGIGRHGHQESPSFMPTK